jgi:hypothetical protein
LKILLVYSTRRLLGHPPYPCFNPVLVIRKAACLLQACADPNAQHVSMCYFEPMSTFSCALQKEFEYIEKNSSLHFYYHPQKWSLPYHGCMFHDRNITEAATEIPHEKQTNVRHSLPGFPKRRLHLTSFPANCMICNLKYT